MNEPKIYNGISFVPKGNVIQIFDAYTGQYYGSQPFDSLDTELKNALKGE